MEQPYIIDGLIYKSKTERIITSNKRNSDLLYYKSNKIHKIDKILTTNS